MKACQAIRLLVRVVPREGSLTQLILLQISKEDVLKERQSGYAIWTVVEKEEVRTGRVR